MREPIGDELNALPVDQLADMRAWQLKRLEVVTDAMKKAVRNLAAEGTSISAIAKRSGVTRPTLYKWLAE